MADTRERHLEEARIGSTLPGEEPPPTRRRRRPWVFLLAVVVGVLVYALAFQQTDVSLDPIQSETRQESLFRILRALARPELVTYDTVEQTVATEIAVPCGPSLARSDRLSITPECAAPGSTVTVSGTGFDPGRELVIQFVPDSEFNITLRLAETTTDGQGTFASEVVLPERESESPQQIQVVSQQPIGSWSNRIEVYTDANENGVEDDPILPDEGTYRLTLDASPEVTAVALLNPTRDVVQFVSTGDPFEAVDGLVRGQTAVPVSEETPESGVRIGDLATTEEGVELTITGPPETDLSNWRAAVYDASTGEMQISEYLTDTVQLSPRISETAKTTWDKILETVFLALLATTAGLLVAVPLSFIAARNIMRDISTTVTNLALTLIAVPVGAVVGVLVARLARSVVDPLTSFGAGLVLGVVITVALAWLLIRAGVPPVEEDVPTRAERLQRGLLLVLAGVVGLIALLFASRLLQQVGTGVAPKLGIFDFVGGFFADVGEILDVALVVIAALAGAGLATNLAAKLGYGVRNHAPRKVVGIVNVVLSALAGAVWAVLTMQVIDWFYIINNTTITLTIPAIVGAVLGVAVSWRGMAKGEVDVGLSVYYLARTVFNTLRSIEPLVMVIVFVVWVGLGPFAGALALALHTAAALAKLYSEQVESIAAGPIEAVRATGANRLQTIVYAVVPQIIPPYISFTMYRWDINVRMSTILGFAGGGGIGSILQQNVNLLNYRAAAVQMLAIVIVVASMDYASSRLRERYV